jgi:hypothetical protein
MQRDVDEESDQQLMKARHRLSDLDRKIENSSAARRTRRVLRRKLKETGEKIKANEDEFLNV